MYKNPIPVLPEDEKYKEFRIQFKYKEAMTTKEAAQEFFCLFDGYRRIARKVCSSYW